MIISQYAYCQERIILKKHKIFHFEKWWWLDHKEVYDLVKESWQEPTSDTDEAGILYKALKE